MSGDPHAAQEGAVCFSLRFVNSPPVSVVVAFVAVTGTGVGSLTRQRFLPEGKPKYFHGN